MTGNEHDLNTPTINIPLGLSWIPHSIANLSKAITAGNTPTGNPIYIARAQSTNEGTIQVGTACYIPDEDATSVIFPFYGKSIKCSRFDILQCESNLRFRWIRSKDGSFPKTAVPVGLDEKHRVVYTCRIALPTGEVVPAKLIPTFHGAFGPGEELEYFRRTYDVLCTSTSSSEDVDDDNIGDVLQIRNELGDPRTDQIPVPDGLVWKFARDGQSFDNAITSGQKNKNGVDIHVVRGSEELELACGALRLGDATASIPYYKYGSKHDCYDVLCNEGGIYVGWISAEDGGVPDGAIQAGIDKRGEAIWISRIKVKDVKIPGKMVTTTKRGYAAYDGKEYVRKNYDILCLASAPPEEEGDEEEEEEDTKEENDDDERKAKVPDIDGLIWVARSDGDIPKDSVVFDAGIQSDCERLFIARASAPRELCLGGLGKGGNCEVPYFGKTESFSEYDVLVNVDGKVKLTWVSAKGGELPEGAIQGGLSNKGDAIYVARGKPGKAIQFAIGKFRVGFKCAFVAFDDVEKSVPTYDILCIGNDNGVPALSGDSMPSSIALNVGSVAVVGEKIEEVEESREISADEIIPETSIKTPAVVDIAGSSSTVVAGDAAVIDMSDKHDPIDEETPLIPTRGWVFYTGDFYNGVDYCWWLLVSFVIIFLLLSMWWFITRVDPPITSH